MIEKLFGISALEKWFESFMTKSWTGVTARGWKDWIGINFQFKSPVCPHYQLVELCAEAMEIKQRELGLFSHFCGTAQKNIMVGGPSGDFQKVGGVEKVPFYTCEVIANLMEIAISVAKSEKPEPVRKISEFPDKKEKERVKNYFADLEAFGAGQEILKKWKSNIPLIILMEKGFSDPELISKMENLQKKLKDQAVIGCKRAPKHERNQWLYID